MATWTPQNPETPNWTTQAPDASEWQGATSLVGAFTEGAFTPFAFYVLSADTGVNWIKATPDSTIWTDQPPVETIWN